MGGIFYATNPKFDLPDIYRDLVNLWQSCQGGEFGGQTLPDAGGMLDQLNWLTEAFAILSVAFHDMRKDKRGA